MPHGSSNDFPNLLRVVAHCLVQVGLLTYFANVGALSIMRSPAGGLAFGPSAGLTGLLNVAWLAVLFLPFAPIYLVIWAVGTSAMWVVKRRDWHFVTAWWYTVLAIPAGIMIGVPIGYLSPPTGLP